ncbi:hypothetical protein [Nocardioides sambongensis]|uniref:hypothetical protein n=1 Tax=Nocardioides sambongensis TaxID=2589074 RepID=UPI00112EB60E|nr:hypothetical protein [Nocardioides sambongensis]
MAERVVLHIGAPKSGTTYLQSLLWHNRSELRERGLFFPGKRLFDQNRASIEVRAGRHLRGEAEVWARFVRRADDVVADLVLSNEWYVEATAEQIAGIVDDLGADRLHVVFTARDFVAQVPAGWQEELKLGSGGSLDDFVAGLDRPERKWSWKVFDPVEALRPWADHLPADRIHVVTVPPRGSEPGLLLHRFLGLLGVRAEGLDTEVATHNESLGVESARLLQEIGPALLEATDPASTPWNERYVWLRNRIAHQVLVPLGGRPIGLHPDTVERLRDRARASVAALEAGGYDLVGDTADLLDGAPRPGSVPPEDVDPADLVERAGAVSAALLRFAREASA